MSPLPPGWKREVHVRKSGKSKGLCDVYFYSPKGLKFRSRKMLDNYIRTEGLKISIEDFNFKEDSVKEKNSAKKEKNSMKKKKINVKKERNRVKKEKRTEKRAKRAATAQLDGNEHNEISEVGEEPDSSLGDVGGPVTVSDQNNEPVAVSETNDRPVAVSECNEEPVAVSESKEEPVAISESHEEPVAASESHEEPVALSQSEDEPGPDGEELDDESNPQEKEGTCDVNLKRKNSSASEVNDEEGEKEENPTNVIPVPKKRKKDNWGSCCLI